MMREDTIAAIATAQGQGGIAIVRVSGPEAEKILRAAFRPRKKRDRYVPNLLMYGHIQDENGRDLDECMAVFMSAKASYTREDVAEIHCHGGEACARSVLELTCRLGARVAMPGEFTKRAFLNGRIDLARAEAVMSVIGAQGEAALRSGVRQLEGGVSAFVRQASEKLATLLSGIEAATDFPDEISEDEAAGDLLSGIDEILAMLDARLDERGARILRQGASIVLSGRPNVGKSSLMNALLHRDRAIVTDIPGTTRDVLTERVRLGGIWAEISDTAGLRDANDPIERMGVARAEQAAKQADVVLYVVDASRPLAEEDVFALEHGDGRTLVCLNKADVEVVCSMRTISEINPALEAMEISAKTGQGLDALTAALRRRVGAEDLREDVLVSQRHIDLARQARNALTAAKDALLGGMYVDLCADDIRRALEFLGEITGVNAREDVIDRVFRNFCVGK